MIGILSDAHGNLRGFERGISLLREFGATQFIFLGDAVGYIPGSAVVKALRRFEGNITCIKGNHDVMVLTNSYPTEKDPVYQHSATRKALSVSDMAFIAAWPEEYTTHAGDYNLLCIHGGPRDPIEEYVYPDSDLSDCEGRADLVFMGHTHRPFQRRIGSTTCINVGSCGLPRDHGSLGCVCLFNSETGEVRLLRYDMSDINQDLCKTHGLHGDVEILFDRVIDDFEGVLTDS